MKVIRLICILALAGAIGACGDSNGGNGGDGGGGSGGDGGTGGSGGLRTDLCTGDGDTDLYTEVGDGSYEAGIVIVSRTAAGCIRNIEDPLDTGPCISQAAVVAAANGQDEEANLELVNCVVECTAEEFDLTPACLTCYGQSVACGSINCAAQCFDGVCLEECVDCRTDAGCFDGFDTCSGLPETDMCVAP